MKTSLKVIVFTEVLVVLACLVIPMTVQSTSAQGKLEGVWKVTETTVSAPKPQTITATQPSLLIFTKKHYSVVMIMGDKPQPDLPQKDATDAQKVATWTPFMASAGTYEVKGATLRMHGVVGKEPSSMTPEGFLTCDYKVEGNTLIFTLKASQSGPIANPPTLKLTRVE
jgi:hypothetical protein